MTTGDFGAQLRQSVQEHLETVARLASEAKVNIAQNVAGLRPAAVSPALPQPPAFSPPPRFNVSFDDAYQVPQAAVSFDDLGSHDIDEGGIPVWEDPA
jgi:hypothetical protein